MHILIVNFNLKDISQEEYQNLCDKLALVYALVPGLISKVWLADPENNTYGGVYTWQSEQAMEEYIHSEIFRAMTNHPNLENVTAKQFGILEGPTLVTNGLVQEAMR
jgi:hypothetical protein